MPGLALPKRDSWRHQAGQCSDQPIRIEGSSDAVELYIVDWEMVQLGDPAWDLAGALHDFLVLWITSMPAAIELNADEMIAQAGLPLACRAERDALSWPAYRDAAGLNPAEFDGFLLRAITYSAARLIQSGLRNVVWYGRPVRSYCSLLQISAHILAGPERARGRALRDSSGSAA